MIPFYIPANNSASDYPPASRHRQEMRTIIYLSRIIPLTAEWAMARLA